MIKYLKLVLFIGLFAFVQSALANNISVSNVGLVGRDISAGADNPANFVIVKFDISWENSWRTSSAPNNWDAAWVFIKYRVGSGSWNHATIHSTGYTAPSGSTVTPSSDSKGVFIYRSSDGTGSVSYTGAKIRWDYGADGVLDNDQVIVKVLAVEMVYVPQGSFYVGSGGPESGSFTNGSWVSENSIPLQITSENALNIEQTAGNLWGTSSSGTNTIGPAGTLSASFPKGYGAFYCMKHSINQGQYVDFLNMLTYTQQVTRTAAAPSLTAGTKAMFTAGQSQHRNGIEIQTSGVESTTPAVYACDLTDDGSYNQSNDGQHLECNWLSWADGIAYSDWAGLRPMTELEFEKACRGTLSPVNNEYVWGSTTSRQATDISNAGTSTETALPDTANSTFDNAANVQGPLRAGNFARSSSTRLQSGATYYGIMDLGGGLWERAVSVGDTIGRLFTGSHGDGVIDANGDATGVSDWPDTSAVGAGFRGGVWDSPALYIQVSNRFVASLTGAVRGGNANTAGTRGFRAVRKAP